MNRKIAYFLGAIATLAVSSTAAQAQYIASGSSNIWHKYTHTNTGFTDYSKSLTDFDTGLTLTSNPSKKPALNTAITSIKVQGGGGYTATLTGNHAYLRNGSHYSVPPQLTNTSGVGTHADTTNYLSIEDGGSATFTLSKGAHYFGFIWGSADADNQVSFYDKAGKLLASFLGSDMVNKYGLGSTFYADFTTASSIWKVVFSTDCDNFEIDGVHVSSVPVPAALPLFGAALAGLGVVSRKRKKTALAA